MSACIKVDGLKKYYGDVKAVDGISFEVEQGTIFGMLGRNGAGKTTTIETLIGLTDRTGGHIEVLGLDPAQDLEELKRKDRCPASIAGIIFPSNCKRNPGPICQFLRKSH